MLSKIDSFFEKRRLRKSFTKPFVRAYGRDTFRYYEHGRSVNLNAELMTGSTGVDRVIYRQCPLNWNDTSEALTSEESERAYQILVEHFNRKKVRWKYYEGRP